MPLSLNRKTSPKSVGANKAFTQKAEVMAELMDEVEQIRRTYPKLKEDSAFVLWFLRAYLANSEEQAYGALTGESKDKGVDAVLIDHGAKQAYLIQGKFRRSLGEQVEKRNDVLGFADIGLLPWQGRADLDAFYSELAPSVESKFKDLVRLVNSRKYGLQLYYVTTGRCSETIRREAAAQVRRAEGRAEFYLLDASQVTTIFKDYMNGVAPAVPRMSLPISANGPGRASGIINRHDRARGIDSWVFSMNARDVGEMYDQAGIRLFARNIRGYLGDKGGDKSINKAMADTIREHPYNFWYYNNGVTIVCDRAKLERERGQDILRVERPQVINGQQTTRTLSKTRSSRASVLVRVIVISREDRDDDSYDDMVSKIVKATNWQNPIKPSDLISNDSIQVFLERELRKHGYQYLRKRQSKSEAKREMGGQVAFQVRKDEFAQAVAACEGSSDLPLKGVEVLFGEPYYRDIFKERSVSFYLPRYWLMTHVLRAAKGHQQRAYAKWLVLNFLWGELEEDVGRNRAERFFRSACERRAPEVLDPLQKAIEDVFKAAQKFYIHNRGGGEEAADRQTFFKKSGLDREFKRYWQSTQNTTRAKADARLLRFRRALRELELPD